MIRENCFTHFTWESLGDVNGCFLNKEGGCGKDLTQVFTVLLGWFLATLLNYTISSNSKYSVRNLSLAYSKLNEMYDD
jgi:hypothetical protein